MLCFCNLIVDEYFVYLSIDTVFEMHQVNWGNVGKSLGRGAGVWERLLVMQPGRQQP